MSVADNSARSTALARKEWEKKTIDADVGLTFFTFGSPAAFPVWAWHAYVICSYFMLHSFSLYARAGLFLYS